MVLQMICFLFIAVVVIRYTINQSKQINHPFWVGVMTSLGNLFSITLIPSLIAKAKFFHYLGLVQDSFVSNLTYSVGFTIGTMFWFLCMLRWVSSLNQTLVKKLVWGVWAFIIVSVALTVAFRFIL